MIGRLNQHNSERQCKAFVKAHQSPHEIKHFAINYQPEADKLFTHPDFLRIPWQECSLMASVDPMRWSALSQRSYATTYRRVAANELYAVQQNMALATAYFRPGDPEFTLMIQESGEETDHVWAFRKMVEHLEPNRFVNLRHDNGDRGADQNDLKARMRRWLFAGMERSPDGWKRSLGFGEIYLFRRYLSNVFLKCIESFLHRQSDEYTYHPAAVSLTRAHAKDEARHYTTSLELGLELFQMRSPSMQRRLRLVLGKIIERFMQASYLTTYERLAGLQGEERWDFIEYLRAGLAEMEDWDVEGLLDRWIVLGFGHEINPSQWRQGRYLARQLDAVIDRFELRLSQKFLKSTAYQRHLAFL